MTEPLKLSELAKAIAEHPRTTHSYTAKNFMDRKFKHGDHKLMIRAATMRETDRSVANAEQYCKSANVSERASRTNAQFAFLISDIAKDLDGRTIFPSGDWILEHLTGDQLMILSNFYDDVLSKENPNETTLTEESLEVLFQALNAFGTNQTQDEDRERDFTQTIDNMRRTIIREALIACSIRLMAARQASALQDMVIEELREKVRELELKLTKESALKESVLEVVGAEPI
jgi:hypothetical protein